MFSAATPDEIYAAQILSGLTLAAFIACGVIPGLRRYAMPMRVGVLVAYILGIALFTAYVLLR